MTVNLSLGGSYPRKEELVKATWNFDKGLVTQAQLDQFERAAVDEVVALQTRLGFSPVTDGQLEWQDAFRPLVSTSASFEVGGVTRLFETNKFYRQPIVHAEPKAQWTKLEPFFPHKKVAANLKQKAILPSPYWFTRVAKDEVYRDEAKLGAAIATYLNDVAKRLERLGYAAVQFNEALLFYESKPDVGFANELFGIATAGLNVETVANFINGDAAPHHAFLRTVPADTIGLDFVETLPEKVHARLQGKPILAQVVNAQESHLESPAEVQDLVARIEARLKPERLTATHTWDLEFVPHEVAVKKLEVLSRLVAARGVAV